MPALQHVRAGPSDGLKTVLFNPDRISGFDTFTPDEQKAMRECFDKEGLESKEIELGIDNFRVPDLLDAVLGKERAVGSYSWVGHIVHLNLKDHHEDYKEVRRKPCLSEAQTFVNLVFQVIGQILLRFPRATLVVNKTSTIDTEFRFFKMEVLAREGAPGQDEFVATVKENGCSFRLDFSRVYWNPRLSTEHDRVVALVGGDDVVFDAFAGVGPFAVPAAKKKGCRVLANDLNPEAYK